MDITVIRILAVIAGLAQGLAARQTKKLMAGYGLQIKREILELNIILACATVTLTVILAHLIWSIQLGWLVGAAQIFAAIANVFVYFGRHHPEQSRKTTPWIYLIWATSIFINIFWR